MGYHIIRLANISLIDDKVIGASPIAIALDAGLAFQLESLRGNTVLGLCTFDDGTMAGAGERSETPYIFKLALTNRSQF